MYYIISTVLNYINCIKLYEVFQPGHVTSRVGSGRVIGLMNSLHTQVAMLS